MASTRRRLASISAALAPAPCPAATAAPSAPPAAYAFAPHQSEAAVEFFREWGFALLASTRSPAELRQLNELCDASQRTHPERWSQQASRAPGGGGGAGKLGSDLASPEQYMELLSPIMFHPELDDALIRGGWGWPVVEELLGGPELCRFVQFDLRETPAAAENLEMKFHRDGARGGVRDGGSDRAADYIAAITLLSPSHDHTPNTVVVPGSAHVDAADIDELREKMGADYAEIVVQQPAGTTLLYDVRTFHTRRDPPEGDNHGRRTQHSYFSRHPAPPRGQWMIYPQRLAAHADPTVRRFYSNWNGLMAGYAASGYEDAYLAEHGEELLMAYLSRP